MENQSNLQDKMLNIIRKKNISVTVYLTNGFQMQGKVISFDNFTVLLDSDSKEQLIYKHAISTIIPEERTAGFINQKAEE